MSRISNTPIGLALVLAAAICMGQPAAASAASSEALRVSNLVKEAAGLSATAPDQAGTLYRKAFQAALAMTKPECSARERAEGLALATRCLHPDLFPEVRIAIDTYIALYPKGRYLSDVYLRKALLEYAEGMPGEAEASIASAAAIPGSRHGKRLSTLQFDGHLTAHKYRSAETWLDSMPASRRVRRDRKRFEKGSAFVAEALEQVRAGRLTGDSAVRALEESLEEGYFGAAAPEATLELIQRLDRQQPAFHRVEVSFLGTVREHRHHLAPNQRLERLTALLRDFPEAEPELRGRALLQAAAVCRYELRDEPRARTYLDGLRAIPEWAARRQIEEYLEKLTPANLDKAEFRTALRSILIDHKTLLPYDNGVLPVITQGLLQELEAINAGYIGAKDDLSDLLDTFRSSRAVRGLPMQAVYLALADNRMNSWAHIEKAGEAVSGREKKMMQDILRPFFLMTSDQDRKLLMALALQDMFPTKAVDQLLSYLTGRPDSLRAQHALALLADLYQSHRSYIEAQSVWKILRTYYPNSVWLR
ncbi:MAG TPA: hypothetical protein PLP29_01245 [Candidatus Ozemobacteraceae bacterium]|nr:hypothetical protein [Candidatus Ozemobacteraceae bacterium]